MKINQLERCQVIHCATEQEAIRILEMAHKQGYEWVNGTKFTKENKFDVNEDETCYSLEEGKFSSRDYYNRNGYNIFSSLLFNEEFSVAPIF